MIQGGSIELAGLFLFRHIPETLLHLTGFHSSLRRENLHQLQSSPWWLRCQDFGFLPWTLYMCIIGLTYTGRQTCRRSRTSCSFSVWATISWELLMAPPSCLHNSRCDVQQAMEALTTPPQMVAQIHLIHFFLASFGDGYSHTFGCIPADLTSVCSSQGAIKPSTLGPSSGQLRPFRAQTSSR